MALSYHARNGDENPDKSNDEYGKKPTEFREKTRKNKRPNRTGGLIDPGVCLLIIGILIGTFILIRFAIAFVS